MVFNHMDEDLKKWMTVEIDLDPLPELKTDLLYGFRTVLIWTWSRSLNPLSHLSRKFEVILMIVLSFF